MDGLPLGPSATTLAFEENRGLRKVPNKPMQSDSYSCHAGCRGNRRARSAFGRTQLQLIGGPLGHWQRLTWTEFSFSVGLLALLRWVRWRWVFTASRQSDGIRGTGETV